MPVRWSGHRQGEERHWTRDLRREGRKGTKHPLTRREKSRSGGKDNTGLQGHLYTRPGNGNSVINTMH
ncbi:hypothetical protein CEXT_570081 [Caerostris extrusa]|uniref:Uncharacterized protein n=1 Tax=Caerostris extrusa TaxID=172846 RepID=A0AAV4PBD2_CAEEX|nr:hypothetical protein CEXT_570081 [Caerostris extrusa]